jgi:uncharacterized protein (DUF362 family)
MGHVYDEFVRELDGWRRRYAGQPKRELVRLFLLALEREELVSVGYREAAIVRRLTVMPIDPEVRELIRHALLWTWKDEEMHSIYIRGAILKLGNSLLRLRAFAQQASGAIGGWTSSVRQHARWSDAPLARGAATALTWAGSLAGKVPRDVRRQLDYGPFRDFCNFNVDAEKTAWLCWSRIIELARGQPDLPPDLVADFGRIATDEENHGRIFSILADALDEHDRLTDGETTETLTEKIGAVGAMFLPRNRQGEGSSANMVGSGGRVFVVQGQEPDDQLRLFRCLLDDSGLPEQLRQHAESLRKPVGEMRVAIKPTFMLGYHRRDRSPLTDAALIDELARWLRELGCADVAVVEGRNIYDRWFGRRSVHDVASYFQISSPHFRLVDLAEEQVPHSFGRGMAQYTVGRTWKEADFRISFGKLRSHPVDLALLALGNLEWIGARCDEYLFVERQAHRQTALMMLIADFPPHFALLDAFDCVPDGVVGMMGCRRPKSPRRFYAGADALAVDVIALAHLGVHDPDASPTLRSARHWFGDVRGRIEVVGVDEPIAGWRSPHHNEISTLLSLLAYPVYELGSGRGALFVPEMDEAAFPPLEQESKPLRFSRRVVRKLIGL